MTFKVIPLVLDKIQETVEDIQTVLENLRPCIIADLGDKFSQVHLFTVAAKSRIPDTACNKIKLYDSYGAVTSFHFKT